MPIESMNDLKMIERRKKANRKRRLEKIAEIDDGKNKKLKFS